MANRRFEDFEVSREFQHAPARTVLDADNTWFTLLTMNQHPLHFDAEYAAKTEFGRVVVNFHGTNASGERQRPGAIVPWAASGAGPQAEPKATAVGHLHGSTPPATGQMPALPYASAVGEHPPAEGSCLTLSIVVGMSVSDVSQTAIANLGWDKIRLLAPVFLGDTLYASSRVIAARESSSRPGQGIVTVKTVGTNQDGLVVIEFERTVLVPKREAADVPA